MCSHHCSQRALPLQKADRPRSCVCYLPKTRIFLPEGSLDLDRVETSLSIDDLEMQKVRSGHQQGHTARTHSPDTQHSLTAPWVPQPTRAGVHSPCSQTRYETGKNVSSFLFPTFPEISHLCRDRFTIPRAQAVKFFSPSSHVTAMHYFPIDD